MRYLLVAFALALAQPALARVEVGVGISIPGVDIGIHVPSYPRLVRVPGYPVYYAPDVSLNFFFYDGLYWSFIDDDWYASSWYDGPWRRVERDYVPLYVLRVPVRYYRRPPAYFRPWHPDTPPHWGERWGRDWQDQRGAWDKWDRRSMPPPAPPPAYQRSYSGPRYPQEPERQRRIEEERYRYQPRDESSRRYYQYDKRGPGRDDRGGDRRR